MKRNIALRTDCLPDCVDADEALDFFRSFGFGAQKCGELFGENRNEARLRSAAIFLASIRIKDFETPLENPSVPSRAEVEEELSKIRKSEVDPSAAYDGFWFQRKLHAELAAFAGGGFDASFVYTGRLLCTYGQSRYHARVVIMGCDRATPQIVSHAGVVEGPAKPPDYYWAKGRLFQEGFAQARALSVLDEVFEGKFVKPSDPLAGRIVSAYGLQPLIYVLAGKQFCEDENCSIFNSHRQSEVLNAQGSGRVCKDCMERLGKAAI